jgi:hypothetical protein
LSSVVTEFIGRKRILFIRPTLRDRDHGLANTLPEAGAFRCVQSKLHYRANFRGVLTFFLILGQRMMISRIESGPRIPTIFMNRTGSINMNDCLSALNSLSAFSAESWKPCNKVLHKLPHFRRRDKKMTRNDVEKCVLEYVFAPQAHPVSIKLIKP